MINVGLGRKEILAKELLKLILEERIRLGKSKYIECVDIEEVFDNVNWNTTLRVLAAIPYEDFS